ncbi:MAG: hypothetical protein M3R38_32495 [Actinomycetota bacterium]|nr:hypothetical protein [Actinomycetota bacterium]
MNKDNARLSRENPAEGHSWITPEEVAASAPRFDSRGELAEAFEDKGWAVFVSADGETVAAPLGATPLAMGARAARASRPWTLTARG